MITTMEQLQELSNLLVNVSEFAVDLEVSPIALSEFSLSPSTVYVVSHIVASFLLILSWDSMLDAAVNL